MNYFEQFELHRPVSANHECTALFITRLDGLTVTSDSSIVLITMPATFRGIELDPREPSSTFSLP